METGIVNDSKKPSQEYVFIRIITIILTSLKKQDEIVFR